MSSIMGRSSILITGLEGSGKSHFVMSQIKQILDTPDNEYEIFLANVDGVTLTDPKFHLVDPEFSWVNDAPKNSIVIYDEAGTIERFNNSHTKINSHVDVETLTMRRHKNVLVVFVAQDHRLVHSGLRQLLKFHFHFSNPYSSKTETKCFITAGVNNDGKKTIIEEFDHELDQDIFPLYKSVDDGVKHDQVTVKNKKAQLMQRIAVVAMLLAIPCFIGMFYLIKKVKDEQFDTDAVNQKVNSTIQDTATDLSNKANPTNNPAGNLQLEQNNISAARTLELYEQRLPQDYLIYVHNDDLRVSAVIGMGGSCKAYNVYGDYLNIPKDECLYYLNNRDAMIHGARSRQSVITERPAQSQLSDSEYQSRSESNEVTGELAPLPQDQLPQSQDIM